MWVLCSPHQFCVTPLSSVLTSISSVLTPACSVLTPNNSMLTPSVRVDPWQFCVNPRQVKTSPPLLWHRGGCSWTVNRTSPPPPSPYPGVEGGNARQAGTQLNLLSAPGVKGGSSRRTRRHQQLPDSPPFSTATLSHGSTLFETGARSVPLQPLPRSYCQRGLPPSIWKMCSCLSPRPCQDTIPCRYTRE